VFESLGPDFEAWASQHLRATFPERTAGMPDEELRDRVRSCAALCGRHGLATEEQVLCIAAAGFLIGADFDSDPNHAWAAEILADAELSADERAAMVAALAELLVEEAGDGESR
jgi:hypothetical protein